MDTVKPTRADIDERIARFDRLQPMSTMKDNDRVPRPPRTSSSPGRSCRWC